MTPLAQIAQTALDLTAAYPVLLAYGPMGVFCMYFMWRGEKLIVEIRTLGHRFKGLEMALLMEAVSRENCPQIIKHYANGELDKMANSRK